MFGDAGRGFVAQDVVGITEEQISSPWYMPGWLTSGYLGFGDVRDSIYNLVNGNFGDAVLSAVGLLPFIGDAAKTVVVVKAYIAFGGAAGAALRWLSRNLPAPFKRVADEVIQAAAAPARLAQDVAVRGRQAPRALPLTRPIGRSATQNARLQSDIAGLQAQGATQIRVNQWQVDVNGVVVGRNRPDLQYTLNGKRHYVEYDTAASGRGGGHTVRLQANDPSATIGDGIELIIQD